MTVHETHRCRDCDAEITLPYAMPDDNGPLRDAYQAGFRAAWAKAHDAPQPDQPDQPEDIFDRLMALWQEPWSELAFGEAQMLVGRLRTVLSGMPPPGYVKATTIEAMARQLADQADRLSAIKELVR